MGVASRVDSGRRRIVFAKTRAIRLRSIRTLPRKGRWSQVEGCTFGEITVESRSQRRLSG